MSGLLKSSTIRPYDRGLAEAFSLKSLWMLWEGSGAPFEQRSGRQATLSASKPTWVTEEEGAALSFASGSSQYVQLRNVLPNLALTGTTVMARFKPKATLVNGMAAGAVEFATNRALGVGSDSSGHVGAIIATSNGTIVQAAGSSVWTNKWVTAAATTDGANALVYENGLLAASGGVNGSPALTNGYADTVIGCNVETAGTRLPFNGPIAWGAIFGQLTPDQIFWLYANDFPACLFKRRALFKPAAAGGGTTYTLTAAAGSFTLTGQAVSLKAGRKITAAAGSYALTGQAAALKFNRVLAAAAGSFVLTGSDASLTYTPNTGPTYTLTAGSGSYTLTGVDASLLASRVLRASGGQYVLNGSAAVLRWSGAPVWTPADTASGSWSATSPASAAWTAEPIAGGVWN